MSSFSSHTYISSFATITSRYIMQQMSSNFPHSWPKRDLYRVRAPVHHCPFYLQHQLSFMNKSAIHHSSFKIFLNPKMFSASCECHDLKFQWNVSRLKTYCIIARLVRLTWGGSLTLIRLCDYKLNRYIPHSRNMQFTSISICAVICLISKGLTRYLYFIVWYIKLWMHTCML